MKPFVCGYAQKVEFSEPTVQYRERSDRMTHSISAVILTIALLSVASGRFARGTALGRALLFVQGSCVHHCFFGSSTWTESQLFSEEP